MITAETLINDLERFTFKEIAQSKDEKTAMRCANAVFDCIYLNFSTRLMYIPSSLQQDIKNEHDAIYKEFMSGLSYKDLAIKYRRSVANIYTITNNCRRQKMRKHQHDLFPYPEQKKSKPFTLVVIEEHLPVNLIHSGLSDQEAADLAAKISARLCKKFPGISVYISKSLNEKRVSKNQKSIF